MHSLKPYIQSMLLSLLLLSGGLIAIAQASAQPVLYDKSRVSAVSRQMNIPVEAQFRRFSAEIAFDAAKPETSKARIEIEVGSFDIGVGEINDDVKGRQWFDAKTHPKATFVASAVRALGGGRFEARGALTIKGKTLEVTAPFTWKAEGGTSVYDGQFPIRRLLYNIGEGAWKDTDVVADEVLVKFRLLVANAPAAVKK